VGPASVSGIRSTKGHEARLWATADAAKTIAFGIGAELQYPFSPQSLNHLPLDVICSMIEHSLPTVAEHDA
jgi:hypothetical protein